MRNSSHNTTTAAAELVDNALDADADNVRIQFDKKQFLMLVADDGIGMTPEQLLKAVALGCHDNPDARLGRFGVGLNTSALHLGDTFSVYSKTETTPLHRVDFDPAAMQAKGPDGWENPITDELDANEVALFEAATGNSPSGTLVLIRGINRNFKSYQSVYQYGNTLKKNLGEMFRYFLPPQTLGSNDVTPEAAKNSRLRLYIDDACVCGKDPLERLCPNTTVLHKGIYLTPLGEIEATVVSLSDADIELHNYHPDIPHQGVYVIREGRQILAHDCNIFEELWGGRHPTATHLRAELRYCKSLDPLLLVNHDKVGLKEVDQSVMDMLKEGFKVAIRQFKQQWKDRRSRKPDEAIDEAHRATVANLQLNADQLKLPNVRKASRKKGEALKEPRERKPHQGGEHEKLPKDGEPKKSKVSKFTVEHRDLGAAGPALSFEFGADNALVVVWNTSHNFVQRFITLRDDAPDDTIKGLDNMAFAMAAYWEQRVLEDDETGWNQKDNFLGVLGQNLRVVR